MQARVCVCVGLHQGGTVKVQKRLKAEPTDMCGTRHEV